MLNKLFATRYIIQTFLNTFQNFFFFRVIEKEYKTLRQKLGDANEELQMHHIKMLDNIIRLGFIDNPANNISKEFRRLLGVVR